MAHVSDKALLAGSSLPRFNAAESYAGVIVGVAAADGGISHAEALEVVHALSRGSLFRGVGDQHLQRMLKRLAAYANTHGATRLLEACAPGVPRELRGAAFAWAADIAYCDGHISDPEAAYLKRAAEVLSLPETVTSKVTEVARIRNTL